MDGPLLTFQNADPAKRHFQYLEDLATAYWYSQVLFTAIELQLFDHIESHGPSDAELAQAAACRPAELGRLLPVLQNMELIQKKNGRWYNSQLARSYLLSREPDYMGDFLLYRRYMQPNWQQLTQKVSLESKPDSKAASKPLTAKDDYERRNYHYVQAVDRLARLKAPEIKILLEEQSWSPPILDIGGGAGALGRELIGAFDSGAAVLLDLPEVLHAARRIYSDNQAWQRVHAVAGDFRGALPFNSNQKFGLIIMSNFLHAYGAYEACELLSKAIGLLQADGILLIHDYFPDRRGASIARGGLHDLNMMLNTFNGQCHSAEKIVSWLDKDAGIRCRVMDLPSDSSIILAGDHLAQSKGDQRLSCLAHQAHRTGFRRAKLLEAGQIKVSPWVRVKCRCGCPLYGQKLHCPPNSPNETMTAKLVADYRCALILEGAPPVRQFNQQLLALEKKAFLAGFHKALVFTAGPCPLCDKCPDDGSCRFPQQARPSMEACGIDVYQTARRAGIDLDPVVDKMDYVKYIAMLLIE